MSREKSWMWSSTLFRPLSRPTVESGLLGVEPFDLRHALLILGPQKTEHVVSARAWLDSARSLTLGISGASPERMHGSQSSREETDRTAGPTLLRPKMPLRFLSRPRAKGGTSEESPRVCAKLTFLRIWGPFKLRAANLPLPPAA